MKGINSSIAAAVLSLASVLLPSMAHAQCAPSSVSTMDEEVAMTTTSSYENVGLYEWDETQGVWVLLGATYHPSYETETKQTYDAYVPASTLWSDPFDDRGGWVKPQRANRGRHGDRDVELQCSGATTLPRITATGNRPMDFGGSLLSVIWRGELLSGTYGGGGAQRSSVGPALPAPDTAEPVTCNSEMEVKSRNAQHTAAHYGMKPGPRHRGQKITIEWSTGTIETYVNTGKISTIWLVPVPDTCKSGE